MSLLPADLLLYGSRVLTLDPHLSEAEAVAISNGKIIAVGSERELKPFVASRTQFFSCAGKTILPGFIDPHLHFFAWASRFCGLDLSTARSIAAMRQQLVDHLSRARAEEWLRGYGYDEFFLVEKRHPTRQDLDLVTTDRPILVRHRTGHAAVLNSVALHRIGIDREFQSPIGGFVEKDDNGEPTGVLYEMEPFLRAILPPLAREDFVSSLKQAGVELLRQGVTSFHDASAGNTLADFYAFRRLHEDGVFVSRATVMIGSEGLPHLLASRLTPFAGDEYVRLGSVKIMLHESRGEITPPPEKVAEIVRTAHRHGLQVAIHAVEEGPVCVALEAIAQAQANDPRVDHRHRIEHCSLCPPPLIDALVGTGSVVVMQPGFLHAYGDKYAAEIAPELHGWLYRTKSLRECGVPVAGSSDCPVSPVAPLLGISAAMTRRSRSGVLLNEEESLSLFDALALFTSAGAWVGFEERDKGRIAPGMMADLAVLDGDMTLVTPAEIAEMRVQTTIIGGKIVWDARN